MERRPTSERQREIAEATLVLLAEMPLAHVTTRRVADALGITQPALFRHFRSRDDMIAAAIRITRDQLEQVAAAALGAGTPLLRLEALTLGLFAYVTRSPGIPRLLFQDVFADEEPAYRPLLTRLAHGQGQLVERLVQDAMAVGELPASIDAEAASRRFVGLVQGTLLTWLREGRVRHLPSEAEAMFHFFSSALRGGEPRAEVPVRRPAATERELTLDVRAILARGDEPLSEILAFVDRLAPGGVLTLVAPFRPDPLLALLAGRGFRTVPREVAPGEWHVTFTAPGEGAT